jgi:hypothetical protein
MTMWMPCIKDRGSEAITQEVIVADQDHQEVVAEATTEVTEVVSKGTKNLISTLEIEGALTILKINHKTNKQRLLTKGATTIKITTGEDRTLPDNRTQQENGVLIAAKAHTIQQNVGATKRKQSMTSTMKKRNNLKKKTNLSVTPFIPSSNQKTKI